MPPAPGLPPVIEVGNPVRVGGKLDTLTRRYVGPCDTWRQWLVGERQRAIIDDLLAGRGPRNRLLYSAEGGGKTVLTGMLGWLLVFMATQSGVPGSLGATAPTHSRLGTLQNALCDLGPVSGSRDQSPNSWGTFYVDAGDLVTASGHVIQFRSTKVQSGAVGSPIQGWNWGLGALMDEIQDSIHAYPDVVARLRAGEKPPIFGTATAKDSPAWRNFRDQLNGETWQIERLPYTATPFVHDGHWVFMQGECSPREWRRRGLAEDVGPERMVYTTWDRAENLRPVPTIGAKDVTARILGRYGHNFAALVGHDPGQLQDVSVILKAYEIGGRVCWFVVGEVTTKQTTAEEHAIALRTYLQEHLGVQYPGNDEPKALIKADPYGDNDGKTDRSVYLTFKQQGFAIMSAAYKKGKGNGRVPKDAAIEMVCSLLCNAKGERRLYVATDDRGNPLAPRLVEAIELSERDEAGKAETQKKNAQDLSHWPAALRYALWAIERVRDQDGIRSGGILA